MHFRLVYRIVTDPDDVGVLVQLLQLIARRLDQAGIGSFQGKRRGLPVGQGFDMAPDGNDQAFQLSSFCRPIALVNSKM